MMMARGEAMKRGVAVGVSAPRRRSAAPSSRGGWTVFVDSNGNGRFDAGETIVRQQPALPHRRAHRDRERHDDARLQLARLPRAVDADHLQRSARARRARATSCASSRSAWPTSAESRRGADDARADRADASQGGYVLLEALIAVVIAAVGFIGAARLQTLGLAMNNSAQVRQKATLLGYQMADRIRANQAGVTVACLRQPGRRRRRLPRARVGLHAGAARRGRHGASGRPRSPRSCPARTGVVCIDSTPDDGTRRRRSATASATSSRSSSGGSTRSARRASSSACGHEPCAATRCAASPWSS